jgi:hypothetical protein
LTQPSRGPLLRTIDRPEVFRRVPGMPGRISAYFGVSIEAAVNLLEAREYSGLDRPERLHQALAEQQRYLATLLGFRGQAAFDLRIIVAPTQPVPLRFVIVGRTWAADVGTASRNANGMSRQLLASLPSHLRARDIDDSAALASVLDPFGEQTVQAALISKRELLGTPTRPDAAARYYFSVAPFNSVEAEWNSLYRALSDSGDPLVVAVGLFPIATPAELSASIAAKATYYSRLAREDERQGGLYYGPQKLPADAFAVEAEQVFHEYLRRCAQTAYVLRIQVTGPRLSTAIVEAVGSTISPPHTAAGSHHDTKRVGSPYQVRWLVGEQGERVARWNLAALDCYPDPDPGEIWRRLDRPEAPLRLLTNLCDASEAACAFRLPVALDGLVPGFAVRRGQFGHSEAYQVEGPSVALGQLAAGGPALRIPLLALTKHALVAGSPGSGKSTSVLELLKQLWLDHRTPFLVIEPVNSSLNDYRKLAAVPGFADLRVITVGDENAAPLRFNPFEVPVNVRVSEHIANLLACFNAAFGLWQPLPSIYQQALELTYLHNGILSSELSRGAEAKWPTVVEFVRAMRKATSILGHAGDVRANLEAASLQRAQQLLTGPSASAFLTDVSLDIGAMLRVPIILELQALGSGDDRSLMMALFLNAMTEYYKANRTSSAGLAHLTVVEEAHQLLARPEGTANADQAQAKEKAAADFANTLAENRKYGEGLLIAEQIPTKLVPDAVKNTNLKLMHRMLSEEDRNYLGESMGLDESQKRFAIRLGTGEALAYSDEYAATSHVTVQRTLVTQPPPIPKLHAPPFAACRPCRQKCAFRGAALAMIKAPELQSELAAGRKTLAVEKLEPGESRRRWADFLALLRRKVSGFPILPAAEPGLSDAAYCLFLHSIGVDGMDYAPQWPEAVAARLGILTKASHDA